MIFLENSVAMMIATVDIAQLPAQVTAAVAMLDFINNYVMIGTTYLSLGIEWSGLLHCVYLVQYGFSFFLINNNNNKKVDDPNEIESSPSHTQTQTQTLGQQLFFGGRVLLSLAVLGFAVAVTISALLEGKSGMGDSLSPAVSLILFFALLCVVGVMEGMQISAFALLNMSEEELSHHPTAHKNW